LLTKKFNQKFVGLFLFVALSNKMNDMYKIFIVWLFT